MPGAPNVVASCYYRLRLADSQLPQTPNESDAFSPGRFGLRPADRIIALQPVVGLERVL